MDLRATINGIQYDIIQGATFAKEFNETLDSGSIIISGVEKLKNLTPYDDTFIYSFTDKSYKFKGYPFDETNVRPKFYRHLLVDQFTEEVLRLGDKEEDGRYKYKIELMSETKKLETIQCPNISVTQPLEGEKTSILQLIYQFLELYGTQYKKAINDIEWKYCPKYTVGEDVVSKFYDVICPDFSMNTPTLRALLSKLFMFKDSIPYIEDDVLHCLDISKRNGKFDANPKYVNAVIGSRTSDNHCDNLRRNYSDALSQEGVCRSVEYLGFRNSDNALMTISNMRIETGMPIYKINKMYMCYYKKVLVNYSNCKDTKLRERGEREEAILCRQDITKLVLLNTERNIKSLDWDSFNTKVGVGSPVIKLDSVDDMSQYKFMTVGYDIGSNIISGWGDMFTYPGFYNDNQYTYVQNIAAKLDYLYPWGVDSEQYFERHFGEGSFVKNLLPGDFELLLQKGSSFTAMTSGDRTATFEFFQNLISPYTNASLSLKGFFFSIDYYGFYNGAILHSKNNGRDDVTINDNASETLTIIEQDAIFQKEKINRFGNKAVQINARYDKFYDDNGNELIQPLGSVYESPYEDDVVIYHVEYSIFDNCIQCIYYGVKNYVLKNYYTSVFARYRTWNLMSYNESIKRAENKKMYLIWSPETAYYENSSFLENFATSGNRYQSFIDGMSALVSFMNTRNNDKTIDFLTYDVPLQLNVAYLSTYKYDENGVAVEEYRNSVDMYMFTANDSLCFNVRTYDNYSAGIYIESPEPFINSKNIEGNSFDLSTWISRTWEFFVDSATQDGKIMSAKSDYSGSKQAYSPIVDSELTGQTKTMGFYVGHTDKETQVPAIIKDEFNDKIGEIYRNSVFSAPKLAKRDNGEFYYPIKARIGTTFDVYKDNKESVDMTMQIENLSASSNLFISPWVFKLSDLDGRKNKFETDVFDSNISVNNIKSYITGFVRDWKYGTQGRSFEEYGSSPIVTLALPMSTVSQIESQLNGGTLFQPNTTSNPNEMVELDCSMELKFNYSTDKNTAITKYKEISDAFSYPIVVFNSFTCSKIRFAKRDGYKAYNYGNEKSREEIDVCELVGKMAMWYFKGSKMVSLNYDNYVLICPRYGNNISISGSLIPGTEIKSLSDYGKFPADSSNEYMWFSSLYDVDRTLAAGSSEQFTSKDIGGMSAKNYEFPHAVTTFAGGYIDLPRHVNGGVVYPSYSSGQYSTYCLGCLYTLPTDVFNSANDGDIIKNETVAGDSKIGGQKDGVNYLNCLPSRHFIQPKIDTPTDGQLNNSQMNLSDSTFANLSNDLSNSPFSTSGNWWGPYVRTSDNFQIYSKKDIINCVGAKLIQNTGVFNGPLTNADEYVKYRQNLFVTFLDYTINKSFIDNVLSLNQFYNHYDNMDCMVSECVKFDAEQIPRIQLTIPDYGFHIHGKTGQEEVYCSNVDCTKSESEKYFNRSDLLDSDKLPETISSGAIIIAKDDIIYIVKSQQSDSNRILVEEDSGNKYSLRQSNVQSMAVAYLDDAEAYELIKDNDRLFKAYTYNPNSNCKVHWVLGINIPPRTKYYNIYLSLTKFKDMRVFNNLHQSVGESLNYIGHESLYGTSNLYAVNNSAIIKRVLFNSVRLTKDGDVFESKDVSLSITDGIKSYLEGSIVPVGTKLNIDLINNNPDRYCLLVKKCIINGKDYRKNIGNIEIVATANQLIEIEIECGVMPKIELQEFSWKAIKNIIDFDNGWTQVWNVGDRKSISMVVSGTTETLYIRLADKQEGRYDITDGSGTTNAVFEFEDGITLTAFNTKEIADGATSELTAGGWALSEMKNSHLIKNYWDLLPQDLQDVIKEISLTEYSYTGESPRTSTTKLFLPAETEIFSNTKYSAEGVAPGCKKYDQFDFYKTHSAKKWLYMTAAEYRNDDTACRYWLRSPQYNSSANICIVYGRLGGGTLTSGTASTMDANETTLVYVSPCFAI